MYQENNSTRINKPILFPHILCTCCSPASNQLIDFAYGYGYGRDFRYNYITYSCWAVRTVDPDACPVEDIKACLNDIINMPPEFYQQIDPIIEALKKFAQESRGNVQSKENWENIFEVLAVVPRQAGELCSAVSSQDYDEVLNIVNQTFNDINDGLVQPRNMDVDCSSYSAPSDGKGPCLPPNYAGISRLLTTALVNGMDLAGGIESYNDDMFVEEVMAFDKKYNSAGTHMPGVSFAGILSANYYWPKNIPIPVLGNPSIRGIIAGQLYDAMTPYIWASEMRNGFKFTSMLTSQSLGHGLFMAQDGGECQKIVQNYFEVGVVEFVDGTVCGADFPYFSSDITI